MSLVLADNFNSDTVGGSPAGWSALNGGGTIQNFGPPPPSTPVPGGPNHCVGLNGSIYTTFTPLAVGVLCFSFGQSNRPLLSTMMNLKSTGSGGTFSLLTLLIEQDYSISAIAPAGMLIDLHTLLPANSNVVSGWYTYPSKFDFFQLNFTFAENGDHSIQVSATLIIDGTTVFAASRNSGLFTTTQCPANVQTIEFVNSTIGIPGSFLDNVTIDSDPASGYPFPGNPTIFFDFSSQLAFEHLDQSSNEKAYVSQLTIEHPDLPSSERAYVSQLVIEVIQAKAAPPPGGWSVKEM